MTIRRTQTTARGRLCAFVLAGLVAAALALPAAVAAQEDDPFDGALFAAELVMGNQEAIGLTADQRSAIVVALQRTQSTVVPWQLSLSAAAERLLQEVRRPQVDVERALAEAEEALRLENQVKLEHVRLLIEIKNILSRDQQHKLDAIRERRKG